MKITADSVLLSLNYVSWRDELWTFVDNNVFPQHTKALLYLDSRLDSIYTQFRSSCMEHFFALKRAKISPTLQYMRENVIHSKPFFISFCPPSTLCTPHRSRCSCCFVIFSHWCLACARECVYIAVLKIESPTLNCQSLVPTPMWQSYSIASELNEIPERR